MNSPDEQIIKLELPLKEVNQILGYLGQRKYSQVAVLVAKMQSQTLQQVNPNAMTSVKSESKDV